MSDWKDRLGVVFSTNPDFNYVEESEEPEESGVSPEKQRLHVYFTKAGRGGKTVTIVDCFKGSTDELKALEKKLKTKLGVGGSSKEGQIIIQGNVVEKVRTILSKEGYTLKG